MDAVPPSTRRRFLAAGAAATAGALAGCTDGLWGDAGHARHERVSLTVKTPPTDDDPFAIQIASHLAANLRAAGVDAVHEPVAEGELYREVLVDREFEVFVGRHPGLEDVDGLRSLLHSRFANERGWQNPFGVSDGAIDALLERQTRQQGYERLATFTDLFEYVLGTTPYTVVAFPERLGGVHRTLELSRPPRRPLEFLSALRRRGERDGERPMRVATLERYLADGLNPLVVGVGDVSSIRGLVYDPLVRNTERGFVPWLAERVEWSGEGETEETTATATLREGTTWHDGTALDAADVAFTFEFVDDTSLGSADSPVPASRFRGRTSLVEEATAIDHRRVRFSFGERSREVARRALTVPVLPKHVWESRTDPVDGAALTEALVWDNPEPVGSGLLSVADVAGDGSIALEPFDDHPLLTAELEGTGGLFDGSREFSAVEFLVSPNAGDAIDRLLEGDVDLISSQLPPDRVAPLEERESGRLVSGITGSFYFVGYNFRHPDLGNHQFRRAVSRLLDREFVVDEFFGGHGEPARSHSALAGVAPGEWDFPRTAGVPGFPGADGEVDEEAARSLFVDAGYRYEDGDLVV